MLLRGRPHLGLYFSAPEVEFVNFLIMKLNEMPCCLLNGNTVIAHTPALWLTGVRLILTQVCPDQSVCQWEMAEEVFSVQGDLGTLSSMVEPFQSKWKQTNKKL